MLGLFKKTPKLEARFEPRVAVGRELAREVQLAGVLVLRHSDGALSAYEALLHDTHVYGDRAPSLQFLFRSLQSPRCFAN